MLFALLIVMFFDSERARHKVTREVKALAKLDHSGIVRYYQSWFECPPPGWQEERDKVSIDLTTATRSAGVSPTDGMSSAKVPATPAATNASSEDSLQQYLLRNDVNPLRCADSLSGFGDRSDKKHSVMLSSAESVSESHQCNDDVSLQIHSTAGSSLFDISFQDSCHVHSYCSKLISHGSGDRIHAEGSVSVVFEDSASMLKPRTFPDTSQAPADRPHMLDIRNSSSVDIACERKSKVQQRKLYLYIQMQLCQPQSLKDWLNSNTLSRDKYQLLNMFHQIASAIGYVHQCGLMHRDLKVTARISFTHVTVIHKNVIIWSM